MWRALLGLGIVIVLIVAGLFAIRADAPTTSQTDNAILLTEYGLKIPVSSPVLEGTTYRVAQVQGLGSVLHMQSPDVKNQNGDPCELGAFYKIQKNAIAASRTSWTKAKLEAAMSPQNGSPAQVKSFTDFYLVFEPSQAVCATGESDIQKEQSERANLWESLKDAQFAS